MPDKIQQEANSWGFFCFDDVVLDKDVEARYIRTRIIKMENRRPDGVYRGDDAQHTEQYFNLKELPEELKKSTVKE